MSRFKFSAWTWSDLRQQFYLHQYTPEQPDLNYRSPLLIAEMKDVLGFWMARGVDGFRMDAVPYLVEDEQFRDEPLSGLTNDTDDYDYTVHIYTENLPETRAVLTELWDYVKNYSASDGQDRWARVNKSKGGRFKFFRGLENFEGLKNTYFNLKVTMTGHRWYSTSRLNGPRLNGHPALTDGCKKGAKRMPL